MIRSVLFGPYGRTSERGLRHLDNYQCDKLSLCPTVLYISRDSGDLFTLSLETLYSMREHYLTAIKEFNNRPLRQGHKSRRPTSVTLLLETEL